MGRGEGWGEVDGLTDPARVNTRGSKKTSH